MARRKEGGARSNFLHPNGCTRRSCKKELNPNLRGVFGVIHLFKFGLNIFFVI